MSSEELRDALKHQPFGPFRLVMTDGAGYEIRHSDLLWVGRRSAMIGLTGEPAQTFYERAVQVDLRHVIRLEPIEPLESARGTASNGST
jgi:hypothetical protein